MILNLPNPQVEFSTNIFYWLLCEAMNNKRLPGDNYKGDTQKLTQTHLFYDLNALMNVEAVSLGKFDLLYHEGRLQGGYKNAASKFKSGSFKSASSSIFLLNDGDMVADFDTQVKTDYAAAYKKATEFARRYFDCAASARNDKLIREVLYLILHDNSISNAQSFYVCSDGSAKTKDDLGSMIDFEFEAFLLGVWHYLVTTQRLQADLKNVDKITVDSEYQQLNVRLTYSQSVIVPKCKKLPESGSKAPQRITVDEISDDQNANDAHIDYYPSEIDRDTDIISILENSDIALSRGIFFYLLAENIQTIHPKRDRNADRRLFLDLLKLIFGHDFDMRSDRGLSRYRHDKFWQFQMLYSAHCLDDQVKIDDFSDRLHQNYADVLGCMIEIRKKYFCSEEKNEALVVELIEFICNDHSIAAEQEFMVYSDGSALTKEELCDAEELEFEPFLLGVWYYVVSQLDTKDSADEDTFNAVFRLSYRYNGKECESYRSGDIINEQSERYIELYYLE